ncbi:MBG domain-containing protein [Chitinophaga eiseniae]|uniref:Gliding motility-associated C-terminal domain-containing protein n=1 Tax=Chitinophaga eiseniae TaxID=634771 RepID=A0A847SW69_9BACT|nr:MBG domain-containing protein [Chitinophaga eiseniae]NLR82566.1 gliding motility-associated C-terminal domain-containing protein [Chitinophaga eiseniae]
MKATLRKACLCLLLSLGIVSSLHAQTIGAGDLVFTGINSFDDNNNGSTQNDLFSFVLLRDCPANTVIYFTDLGWTDSGFQSTSCTPAGNGSQTDGVIQWNSGSTVIRAGQQIVVYCKYAPLKATIGGVVTGTVTGITATQASASKYVSLGLAGDELFAFTGSVNNPTLIAGININRKEWDITLGSCDFTSSQSMQPATTTVLKFPSMNAVNGRYNCSALVGAPSTLRTLLQDTTRWILDRTLAAPVPDSANLTKMPPCNLTVVNPDANGIVYVNNNTGIPHGDGSSWSLPLAELRDALTAAADPASGITQVWVAKGVYKPTATGDNSISFVLPAALKLYGGFAGSETTINSRNFSANPTILSGDLGGDDIRTNNITLNYNNTRGTNSRHVIVASDNTTETLIDGFIVTAGVSFDYGGGIYSNNAKLNIQHTAFYGNYSGLFGGAIYTTNTTKISNSIFFGNYSNYRGSAIDGFGRTELTNVTISGNTASNNYAVSSVATTVYNSIISGNTPGTQISSIPPSFGYNIIGNSFYTNSSTSQTINPVTFVNAGQGDLHLTSANFAINSGDPQTNQTSYPVQAGTQDLEGATRIINPIIDLGAYEYVAAAQNIGFIPFTPVTYGDPDIVPGAITNGDTTIIYSSSNTAVADTVNGKIRIKGAGTAQITANAPYTRAYLAAAPQTRTLTVNKKALTVNVQDTSRIYGVANPGPVFLYNSFAYSDDSTAAIKGIITATYGANINSGVGTYAITPNVSAAAAANYTLSAGTGTLTITQAPQTITFGALSNKTYGDPAFALNASVNSSLSVVYTVTSGPATLNGNMLTITGAGDVTITASQPGDANHIAATPVSQTFTVAKATLTVKANDKTRFYNQANPTLDYFVTGFVNSDDSSSVLSGTATLSVNADNSSAPGDYPIVVAQNTLSAANYSFNLTNGTLTINKAAQTITFPPIADKVYGAAPFAPGATCDGETDITYTVTGPASMNNGLLSITGIGTVTVTAKQTGSSNYLAATPVQQTFTVNKAPLVIKADHQQRLYGQNNPTLTYTVTGLVNNEDQSVITSTVTLNTTAVLNSSPGDYPITISGTYTATNYNISTIDNLLTVNIAPQTISFPGIPDKTYGDLPFAASATSDAGLSVNYSVVSGPATVSGNTITITGNGTVTIAANQAGDGNYSGATPVTQSFLVKKATLTITANNKSKAYLQPNPTLDYTATGFVNNEDISVINGTIDVSTTADNNSVPNSYPITLTPQAVSATNYDINFVNGTLTVTPATQTITFNALSNKTYGDADFTLNASSNSGLGISYSVISGPATISGNTVTITGAGNVTIAADQAGDNRYQAAPQVTQSFNIAKAILTVTANNKSKIYLQPNPVLDYTITGFVKNEDNRVVSDTAAISTTADANSTAGNYPITVTTGNISATNYDFTFVNGTLSVTPASQAITFTTIPDKTYGDAAFTVSATSDAGLPITYSVQSGPATISGNTVTITGAGNVTIAADQAGNSNYDAATTATRAFTVNKAVLTVTANNKSRTYGQANPNLDYFITGFVNNEDSSHVIAGIAGISTTADINSVPNNYPITVGVGGLTAANYDFQFTGATLTVTPATQAITFNTLANKTYGDADFTLNAGSSSNLAVTYLVTSGPATISGNTVTITGTGNVTIAASQDGDNRYQPATTVTQSFNVAKATLTVTANNKSKVYLQSNPVLDYTITGFVKNENASVVSDSASISTTADINSVVGTYPITVTTGNISATNYDFTFVNGTLNVTQGTQAITFTAIPNKTYGDAAFTVNASSDAGLPVSYSVQSGPATISGNTVTITGTGNVTIAADQAGNNNYPAASTVTQSFIVNKAMLTVTANNKSRAYGQPNPTFDYVVTGFVNNEDSSHVITGLAGTSTTADVNSVPNNYPITVGIGGLTAANYDFQFTGATLTVTSATQAITFNTIANKTYGDADFTLNASSNSSLAVTYSVVSGPATINGNTVTITGAGNVTIAADQAGDNRYQAATQVTQSFSVAKATLTVTAGNKSKIYLQPNPVLDYTITGFVKNENASVVSDSASISTTANINSTVGTYPITVTTGNISAANYGFTFVNGTLNVTPATQTITFTAIPNKTYGDAAFTINATSDAGLPVSYSVQSGPATISGNTVTITGTGNVTIAADQAGNNNYPAASTVTQSFTVNKAMLTVTANNKSRAYGQPNPTFDYVVTGFVNNEDSSHVITGIAGTSTTADVNSVPNNYPITIGIGGLTAANYDFQFTGATLTVTSATQAISFNALANKTYGDADFTLNASSSSSLAVTYSVVSGPATINGNTVTITGAGNVTIAADQAGDNRYQAATQVTQSFSVAKATLTVTANNKSKIYLQPNPVLDYTITGFVKNENASVVSDSASISTTANINSTVGTYPITVTTGNISAANYGFTFVNGTLNVTPATQTIAFTAIPNKTYGDAAFTINATSDAGLAVSYSVQSGPATINGNTVTITGTGNVTIAANQAGNSNYPAASTVTQSFTVSKAMLTVTANNKSRTYGQPNPAFDYVVTGFVNNEDSSHVITGIAGASTTADVNSVPNNYPITVGIGGLTAANYDFQFTGATLTVTPATQAITFNALVNKTYGDADFTLNASSNSSLAVTYSVVSGPATINGNTVTITGAGNVTVAANQAGDNRYQAATQVTQSFSVAKATLTVTANNKSKIYLQPNPKLDYTITGFVKNENNSVINDTAAISTTADINSIVGTYPITVTTGNISAANYDFNFVSGILSVTSASQTITFTAVPNKTYGDAAFTINATSDAGLPVSYSVQSGPATINGNTVTITGTGNVTIAANQAGNSNYPAASTVTQSFIVNKAMLTVTANNKSRAYGQPNPTFGYVVTGFVNNEDSSHVITGIAGASTTADVNSVPNNYPITVGIGGLTAANYDFQFTGATLTVTPATQAITFNTLANKTYGDADFTLNASSNSSLAITYSVVSGPATISGNTVTITGAGNVTIAADQAGDNRYQAAAQVTQSFSISKAILTVTANNKSKIYLQPNPKLDYTITGFVKNENASVVSDSAAISTTADINSTIGTYPITVTTGNISAANYDFNFVNGTLAVTSASQTITFSAIANKTYGDAAFTVNATSDAGLPVSYSVQSGPATINGNTVTITGAGSIAITASQAGNSNYGAATPVTQTLQVAKAALTVKANDDTRVYNGTAYTGGNGVSYSGFVNGDDATKLSGSLSYAGSSQSAIDAGSYIITPAGLSSSNYDISFTNGQLVITRATQQITFNSPGDKNQGDPDFTLTASSSSGLPVTFSSDASNVISVTGNTAKVGAAGVAHITATQPGNNNYEAATAVVQTINVTAYSEPVITASGDIVFCEGGSVTLQSSTAPAYEWYLNNVKIAGANSQSLLVKESGNYSVKAIYSSSYQLSSTALQVTVHPTPVGNVQANGNTTISKGETIRLVASGGSSYSWEPATGLNNPAIAAPMARPAVTTTYQVTISNAFGCSVTRDITITVKEDYKLEANNIITPNGDGKNDTWVVKNIDMYPQNEVKVFDRAGRLVFQQHGYTNNWNATVNGQPLAEGTYYYIIDLGDNKPQFKGFITIIHQN